METRLLDTFLEVAHRGSFAEVARALRMDPSSVSRAVSLLEREVGARLFQRTTRRLALTEAGEQFLARIEPIMAELKEAQVEVASSNSQPRGRLCLSASVAFGQICLMPLVPLFMERYPEIDLNLKFTDRNIDFVSDRVDLAVRLAPSVEADVVGTKLMSTRYRVCASPDYLRRAGPITAPSDLADHPAICFDLPDYRRRWIFRDQAREEIRVGIHPRLVISSILAVRDAALAGLGPTLLTEWLIRDDLEAGSLVDVFPDHDVTATGFDTAAWLLYPSRSFLPRKTRVAIDFLRQRLRP